MGKQKGRCAFCQFYGRLTNEHVWADWLAPHLKRTGGRTIHSTSRLWFGDDGLPRRLEERGMLTREGDPRSQKLRAVCGNCNNGWMSRIQNAAKPYLIPLINGQWPNLGIEERLILAAWSTMFTMVTELTDPATCMTTQAQRETFRTQQVPPPRWAIYFGKMVPGDVWGGGFNHFSLSHHVETNVDTGETTTRPYYLQVTAAVADQLYIQTWSDRSTVPEPDYGAIASAGGLALIWPNEEKKPIKAPVRTMTADDADQLVQLQAPPGVRLRSNREIQEVRQASVPQAHWPCPCGSNRTFADCHGALPGGEIVPTRSGPLDWSKGFCAILVCYAAAEQHRAGEKVIFEIGGPALNAPRVTLALDDRDCLFVRAQDSLGRTFATPPMPASFLKETARALAFGLAWTPEGMRLRLWSNARQLHDVPAFGTWGIVSPWRSTMFAGLEGQGDRHAAASIAFTAVFQEWLTDSELANAYVPILQYYGMTEDKMQNAPEP